MTEQTEIHELQVRFQNTDKETIATRWIEAWGEKLQKRNPALSEMYPINRYIVAIHNDDNFNTEDKGKPVGFIGYQLAGDFAFFGDAYVKPEYRTTNNVKGVYSKLADVRDANVVVPKIAGLKPKATPLGKYLNMQRGRFNWIINPSEKALEQFPGISEKTIEWFRERYESDPNAAWAVKKYSDSFEKTWRALLIDYEPVGE